MVAGGVSRANGRNATICFKMGGGAVCSRLRQNDTSLRAVRSKYGLFAEGRNGRCRAHRFVQGHAVIKAGIHGGSKRVSFCKRQNSQNDCVCRFFVHPVSDSSFDIGCNQPKHGRCSERRGCLRNRHDRSDYSGCDSRRTVCIKRQPNRPLCLFGKRDL